MRDALYSLRFLFLGAMGIVLASQVGLQAQQQQPKLESCKPVAERTGAEGCWILSSSKLGARLGTLPEGSIYWTLDTYPTRESAQAAATENGTVVEALGRVWLFTVGAKLGAPTQGTRVTEIGPIAVKAGQDYTAQYREAIMQPGSVSRTHLHSGPEVFYTEAGETCLETPAGKEVGSKGKSIVAAEGDPMELMATGSDMRRGIVLVLHDSSKPHTTLVTDWVSKGLCKAGR